MTGYLKICCRHSGVAREYLGSCRSHYVSCRQQNNKENFFRLSLRRKGEGKADAPRTHRTKKNGLVLNYTFSTFIVGGGNQFAHAAARAVAEDPGKNYNPLFIYGGVGLGKTHLINAIGHEAIVKQGCKSVFYLSSESFTNELICAFAT